MRPGSDRAAVRADRSARIWQLARGRHGAPGSGGVDHGVVRVIGNTSTGGWQTINGPYGPDTASITIGFGEGNRGDSYSGDYGCIIFGIPPGSTILVTPDIGQGNNGTARCQLMAESITVGWTSCPSRLSKIPGAFWNSPLGLPWRSEFSTVSTP